MYKAPSISDLILALREACGDKLVFNVDDKKIIIDKSDFPPEELYLLYKKVDEICYSSTYMYSYTPVYHADDDFVFYMVSREPPLDEYLFWSLMVDAVEDFVKLRKEDFPKSSLYIEMISILEK